MTRLIIKKSNLRAKARLVVVLLLLVLGGASPVLALERFYIGEDVTLGDFLYNDDYTPATTTNCYLSVYEPAPSLTTPVDNQLMSTTTTGWHYHTFAPTAIPGTWPASMTCGTAGVDLIVSDKSFVLTSTTSSATVDNEAIATAVWNNNDRSVSTTTNIVAGVWGATTRTLSTLSNVFTDIWGGSSRSLSTSTLSEGGTLATETYVAGETATLSGLINSASSSLVVTIPEAINLNIENASSSLFALLSAVITGESSTLGLKIENASSTLASQLLDTQGVITSAISVTVGNASSSLYALLTDVVNDAESTLSGQLTSASSSLFANLDASISAIPGTIITTVENASSSLYSLLSSVITAGNDLLSTTINNASTSLASQISSSTLNGSADNWYVTMSNVDRVLIGEKYKAKIYVTDNNSTPTDSAVAPKISLYNNDGDPVTEDITMTKSADGSYWYNYTIPDLAEGLWEAEVKTEVESGKIITTNDYFAIEGSPPQVRITDITDRTTPDISARVLITNEGSADYEYHYEWCVVSDVNYACRGGHDLFYGSGSKKILVGEDYTPDLTATGLVPGNYYFKLVVYYGMEKSGASRYFVAEAPSSVIPPTPPGGGGGGGDSKTPSTCRGADFNHDKKVNSVDFSILLSFWKAVWPFKNPCVDTNNDKKVNSADFSMLMYEWGKKIP